jgi:hypothetical protein
MFESRPNKNERRKTKLFLPHHYSSLRAVLARGLCSVRGEKEEEKK